MHEYPNVPTGSTAEAAQIEAVFRLIDREAWIVTAAAGDRRGGLLATWVARASLDPSRPVCLAALGASHFTTELVLASREFAAHLLRPEDAALAWQFALTSGRDRDKLAGLQLARGMLGAPILENCLAVVECRVVKHYNARERHYFWGAVVAGRTLGAGPPLRESQFFAAGAPEQRRQARENLATDIAQLAPLVDAWLAE